MIGLLPLAIGLFLVARGLLHRPVLSGLSIGLASGLVAESLYRAHCPYSGFEHMLPWHSGAIVLMSMAGLVAGWVWSRRQTREWRGRRFQAQTASPPPRR